MSFEFKITRRVEFFETDMAGIMHFSNYFRMMEATEHAFFRSLGLSIHDTAEGSTLGWPRVNVNCDFRAPLRFEDEVEIHLLVSEVRTRSIHYQFIFRKPPEGGEVARGTITAVCVTLDKATGKLLPVTIPERIRSKITEAPQELLKPTLAVMAS